MKAPENALRVSTELEEKMREATGAAKRLAVNLLLGSWLVGWGGLALFGYAFGLPTLLYFGLGVAGLTVAGVSARRFSRRRRLRLEARDSLVAKAELEGLHLDRETASVLGLFDLAYKSARERLSDPDVLRADLGIDVLANLERAREHLFRLTTVEIKLRQDLRRMTELGASSPVAAALDETRKQIADIDREANAIVGDAQKLSSRITEVHRLIGSGQKSEETRGRLQDALRELDITASAYKEIDDSTVEAAQRRVEQLRKQGVS